MSWNRPLKPWEIAARRRNAKKSTGPRTPGGKRRSATNLLPGLCPRWREAALQARGDDPRQFCRLRRDLIALIQPNCEYVDGLVERLAELWWDKLSPRAPRAQVLPPATRRTIWLRQSASRSARQIDQQIEAELERLVDALSLRSRKWLYRLTRTLGGSIWSATELAQRIESRLATFKNSASVEASDRG
jgi:hypothetical protein